MTNPFVTLAQVVEDMSTENYACYPFKTMASRPTLQLDAIRHQVAITWCAWPFAPRMRSTRALRLQPGAPWQDWSLVAGGSSPALATYSTNARHAVPCALVVDFLMPNCSANDQVTMRAQWPHQRDALMPLHLALGGRPEQLDLFGAFLCDETFPVLGALEPPEKREPVVRIMRALDPTHNHLRLRDLCDRFIDQGGTLEVPDDLGTWQQYAYSQALASGEDFYRKHPQPPIASPWGADIAWRFLHQPPQFDTDIAATDKRPTYSSSGILTPRRSFLAFRTLKHANEAQQAAWADRPLMQVVVRAREAAPEGDWHLSYMEAAAAHDGLNEPELAWNMLCAGCYWVGQRGGNWRVFFDAARALAGRRGWKDITDALDNMAERAQLD